MRCSCCVCPYYLQIPTLPCLIHKSTVVHLVLSSNSHPNYHSEQQSAPNHAFCPFLHCSYCVCPYELQIATLSYILHISTVVHLVAVSNSNPNCHWSQVSTVKTHNQRVTLTSALFRALESPKSSSIHIYFTWPLYFTCLHMFIFYLP
jgi:hypothetical protein